MCQQSILFVLPEADMVETTSVTREPRYIYMYVCVMKDQNWEWVIQCPQGEEKFLQNPGKLICLIIACLWNFCTLSWLAWKTSLKSQLCMASASENLNDHGGIISAKMNRGGTKKINQQNVTKSWFYSPPFVWSYSSAQLDPWQGGD